MSTYFAEHMAKLPYGLDLYTESSTPQCPVGTRVVLGDGRAFVYAHVGSGALAIGELLQVAAPVANHTNCSVAATVNVGDQIVTFTSGATAAAANLYAGGYAHINAPLSSDGGGQCFRIKNHAAWGSSGTGTLNLYDKVRVGLTTTTSKITVRQHPYEGVIQHPLSVTGAAVGVAIMAMTANYYGWIQTTGPCSCRITGTVVIGSGVIPDAAGTAGTLIPLAETSITPELGRVMAVNATATHALIWLAIPGVI